MVRSPGVSIHRAELRALREAGVAVTTATVAVARRARRAGVIGVTGTKGKSTTAALTLTLARSTGRSVALAGNIGVPALDLLDGDGAELVVLELSSYQIADLASGPEVAVVTNLFREHTDWHGSEEAYRGGEAAPARAGGRARGGAERARGAPRGCSRPSAEVRRYGTPEGWDASLAGVSFARRARDRRGSARRCAGEHNAHEPVRGAHGARSDRRRASPIRRRRWRISRRFRTACRACASATA